MSSPKYKKSTFTYHGNLLNGYDVTFNGKYLGFISKFESATRSYWSFLETYNGRGELNKLKGSPSSFGPYKRWNDTRDGLVYSVFPLETKVNPSWIDLESYQF